MTASLVALAPIALRNPLTRLHVAHFETSRRNDAAYTAAIDAIEGAAARPRGSAPPQRGCDGNLPQLLGNN